MLLKENTLFTTLDKSLHYLQKKKLPKAFLSQQNTLENFLLFDAITELRKLCNGIEQGIVFKCILITEDCFKWTCFEKSKPTFFKCCILLPLEDFK